MNEDRWVQELNKLYTSYESLRKIRNKNEQRFEDVRVFVESLKSILQREEAPNTTITCGLCELTGQDAYVEVVMDGLFVRNVSEFFKELAVKCKADNFELFPRTDDKIQMNFTFHGVVDVRLKPSEVKR